MNGRGTGHRLGPVLVAMVLLTGACSSDDGSPSTSASTKPTASTGGDETTTTTEADRPEGPVADLTQEITGGNGIFLADAISGIDLPRGWTQTELVAAGTAHAYEADGDLPADGRYQLTEDDGTTADYRTRVAVRRPPAADFNGTVVVEWLNVSGGLDANPDYLLGHEEILRRGYAWVGVSAQKIGVEGGEVAVRVDVPEAADVVGKGLKGIDADRYGSLEHPGDAFSYDMYTQVARGLRTSGADGPLGELEPERILAIGESQSAFALTTYVNGIQPLTEAFDGFLIHSRGGAGLGLGKPDEAMDIAGVIGSPATSIRTDVDVPVLILETETDLFSLIGYYPARQDDSEHIRLWEVAGTAHADATVLGPIASGIDCGVAINDGPQHFVVKAALRALDTWVRTGDPPPEAPRLEAVEGPDGNVAADRDPDGIALGGIRTPVVDVPVDVLSGQPGPSPEVICLLLGSTRPLPEDRLAQLYSSPDDYLAKYEKATDAAIDAGFVLADDRQALLDDAQPKRVPG